MSIRHRLGIEWQQEPGRVEGVVEGVARAVVTLGDATGGRVEVGAVHDLVEALDAQNGALATLRCLDASSFALALEIYNGGLQG